MNIELTGLKKAVGEYKKYNKGGAYSSEYAYLMLDKATGEVWTDYFCSLGHNDWKEYHDSNIINLGAKMAERGIDVTMENVKKFVSNM